MKTLFVQVALGLALTMTPAPASAAAIDPAYLVVPGQGIGLLHLGMGIADATKILGTPHPASTKLTSIVLPIPDGSMAFGWEPSSEAKRQGATVQGFVVITDRAGMIYEVQAPFDSRYSTPEGIHVGTRVRDVTNILGAPTRQWQSTDGQERGLIYDQRGIAFFIQGRQTSSNYGLVNGIWVFAARTP